MSENGIKNQKKDKEKTHNALNLPEFNLYKYKKISKTPISLWYTFPEDVVNNVVLVLACYAICYRLRRRYVFSR
jgi:hypothetical protein